MSILVDWKNNIKLEEYIKIVNFIEQTKIIKKGVINFY